MFLRNQKRCTGEGLTGGSEHAGDGEDQARGQRTRVDYAVVDPKRTKALRSTREARHAGRMSTEKNKLWKTHKHTHKVQNMLLIQEKNKYNCNPLVDKVTDGLL